MPFKVGDFVICLRNPIGLGNQLYICKIFRHRSGIHPQVLLVSAKEIREFTTDVGNNFYISDKNFSKLTLENAADILSKHVIREEYKAELQNYLISLLVEKFGSPPAKTVEAIEDTPKLKGLYGLITNEVYL